MSTIDPLEEACQTIANVREMAREMRRAHWDDRAVQRWATIILTSTERYKFRDGTGSLPKTATRHAVTSSPPAQGGQHTSHESLVQTA